MKYLSLFLILIVLSYKCFAQNDQAINDLVREGIKLYGQAKYNDAIAKYKDALKLDGTNPNANYELALTLVTTRATDEAIPYLEKVIKSASTTTVSAYDLLGTIYDMQGKGQLAVEQFKKGIDFDPKYQRIHFNYAITLAKLGNTKEALTETENSLKLDPNHSSSHRVYGALNAMNKGNKIVELFAYCNFLMLEPTSARSLPAYNVIKDLLKQQPGSNVITMNSNSSDKDLDAANLGLSMAVTTTTSLKDFSEQDLLAFKLKSIFSVTGELSAKKAEKSFFWSFYADYFNKLKDNDVLNVLARVISLSAFKEDNEAWLKKNQDKVAVYKAAIVRN
ncbi:MAG: tetratricopeptide repeat protein [Pedobacter sp.]|nr:MAG: tetratricopeptide repeat protein [Pedobacter sp.]